MIYINNDSFTKVMVMWNGLKGADSWVLAVRIGSIVVIMTGQFRQRPEIYKNEIIKKKVD
jgi:hypothetical protein